MLHHSIVLHRPTKEQSLDLVLGAAKEQMKHKQHNGLVKAEDSVMVCNELGFIY